MTSSNGFSLNIISSNWGGRNDEAFSRNRAPYVALRNNTEYSVVLGNNRRARCDVKLFINGKEVGSWRISPYSHITIERPLHSDRKFTFFSEVSDEALTAGSIVGDERNGLVKAIFYPEREYEERIMANEGIRQQSLSPRSSASSMLASSKSSSQYSSGVTLLGDRSDQIFGSTNPIRNIDQENITTLTIRLVVKNNNIHPRKKYDLVEDIRERSDQGDIYYPSRSPIHRRSYDDYPERIDKYR